MTGILADFTGGWFDWLWSLPQQPDTAEGVRLSSDWGDVLEFIATDVWC